LKPAVDRDGGGDDDDANDVHVVAWVPVVGSADAAAARLGRGWPAFPAAALEWHRSGRDWELSKSTAG
jgi:hypothetical protein